MQLRHIFSKIKAQDCYKGWPGRRVQPWLHCSWRNSCSTSTSSAQKARRDAWYKILSDVIWFQPHSSVLLAENSLASLASQALDIKRKCKSTNPAGRSVLHKDMTVDTFVDLLTCFLTTMNVSLTMIVRNRCRRWLVVGMLK